MPTDRFTTFSSRLILKPNRSTSSSTRLRLSFLSSRKPPDSLPRMMFSRTVSWFTSMKC